MLEQYDNPPHSFSGMPVVSIDNLQELSAEDRKALLGSHADKHNRVYREVVGGAERLLIELVDFPVVQFLAAPIASLFCEVCPVVRGESQNQVTYFSVYTPESNFAVTPEKYKINEALLFLLLGSTDHDNVGNQHNGRMYDFGDCVFIEKFLRGDMTTWRLRQERLYDSSYKNQLTSEQRSVAINRIRSYVDTLNRLDELFIMFKIRFSYTRDREGHTAKINRASPRGELVVTELPNANFNPDTLKTYLITIAENAIKLLQGDTVN